MLSPKVFSRGPVVFVMSVMSLACTTRTVVHGTGGGASEVASADAPDAVIKCTPYVNVRTPVDSKDDARCPLGRDCLGGLCVVPTDTPCTLSDSGKDGCDENALCLNGPNGARCYHAPPCADGSSCPSGSACNEGALSSKALVCMPDRCLVDWDCQKRDEKCFRRKTTDVVGHCGFNTAGGLAGPYGDMSEGVNSGCPTQPEDLLGKAPAGAPCQAPQDCKPVCCSCTGPFRTAVLAAMCDFNKVPPDLGFGGTCVSAAEACAKAEMHDACYPP